jgi:hypothetical protein
VCFVDAGYYGFSWRCCGRDQGDAAKGVLEG